MAIRPLSACASVALVLAHAAPTAWAQMPVQGPAPEEQPARPST